MSSSSAADSSGRLAVLDQCKRYALVGSPNSGKTTVFNALTGLRSKVANYGGVTVQCSSGILNGTKGRQAELIDLPGTYSLDPLSPEESITLDFLQGKIPGEPPPDGIVFVADSTSLARSLALLGGVMQQGIPVLLVLTMIDEIEARKGSVDVRKLESLIGLPVLPVIGNRGVGIPELKLSLLNGRALKPPQPRNPVPDDTLQRFQWADQLLQRAYRSPSQGTPLTDSLDRWMLHPVAGVLTFILVMIFFFQAIFSWAVPMQDALDGAVAWMGDSLSALLPQGLIQSMVVDGILTGVGSVIVFVPQIALLFLLLTFFEQVGYMSRAVFVVDRVMSWVGLDGRSFVALLSSYACAIPGIMAARSIPDFRQRLTTILVSPLMTCSARLPVYTLLIAAFVPARTVWGFLSLQGLVMLGLYLLGSVTALIAAGLIRRGPLEGDSMPFYVELPPYRWPTLKSLWRGVWNPVSRFLRRAGTVILVASMILWALLSFPRVEVPASVQQQGEAAAHSYQLERSLAAGVGRTLEPAFAPVGFDWRITVGLVASLAAREVIVATLAQIYSVEAQDDDDSALRPVLQQRLAPPGVASPTHTQQLAVALALLIFFVFALQCMSTVAVMRRETGSWKWPILAFSGMFVLAYSASFITYRLTLWLG